MLTADEEPVLRDAIEEKGFQSPFALVEPDLWARWGLENPRRPEVPHPSTVVVAPDGQVIYRESHRNHTVRADPEQVVAIIQLHRTSGEVDAAPSSPEAGPEAEGSHMGDDAAAPAGELDWDSAVSVRAASTDAGAIIRVSVAPGFHVYGARETVSRPLRVEVDGVEEAEVTVPDGEHTDLTGLGEAWVLAGEIALEVAVPDATGRPLTGVLYYQVCTDDTCTAPTSTNWRAE